MIEVSTSTCTCLRRPVRVYANTADVTMTSRSRADRRRVPGTPRGVHGLRDQRGRRRRYSAHRRGPPRQRTARSAASSAPPTAPTGLSEKISRAVEINPGMPRNDRREARLTRSPLAAINALVAEGHMACSSSQRKSTTDLLARPCDGLQVSLRRGDGCFFGTAQILARRPGTSGNRPTSLSLHWPWHVAHGDQNRWPGDRRRDGLQRGRDRAGRAGLRPGSAGKRC